MISLLLSLTASAASPIVSTLAFDVPEQGGDFTRDLSAPGPLHMELGVSLSGSHVTAGFDATRADRVTVQYRYETSISLTLEGPHWDLLDFVHGESGWQPIPAAGGRFLIPPMPVDALVFPSVSSDQIDQAVRAYLGEYGRDAVDLPRCASPTAAPCRVDISRVWLNVSAWRDGAVVESHQIEVVIPMGC